MNILYICDEYPPGRHGGIGTAVQLQARAMVGKGHTVVVAGFYDWGYGGEDEFDDEGVKVFRFRRKLDSRWFRQKDSLRVRATYKLFTKLGIFQYDIQKSMREYGIFLGALVTKYKIDIAERPDFNEYVQYCTKPVYFPRVSIPVVVKIHGTISFILRENNVTPPALVFDMESRNMAMADGVSSVSAYAAERTAQYFGLDRPVEVLHNGVQASAVPAGKVSLQVVYAGSLVEKKGVYQLLRAWNIVAERQSSAKLVLLGKGNRQKASAFLSGAGKSSVMFAGHVPKEELLRYFSSSEVAIFPSYAETFGLAAVEAMSCGTATIFTNRGAGKEIIRDGIDGLIVDPDNVEEIAEKILMVLSDGNLRNALETNGRKRVLEEFEIGRISDKTTAFYERVLSSTIG